MDYLPLKTSQSRLLHVLFDLYGGPCEVARILGTASQLVTNWKFRGSVPLKVVGPIARKLELTPDTLNYEDVVRFLGEGVSWKELIESLELPEDYKKYIMAGRHPTTLEKLCAA